MNVDLKNKLIQQKSGIKSTCIYKFTASTIDRVPKIFPTPRKIEQVRELIYRCWHAMRKSGTLDCNKILWLEPAIQSKHQYLGSGQLRKQVSSMFFKFEDNKLQG